ncbi:hypothetical protein [Mesomycoplasma neurolyticum]|uniref:Lipoprotein n=1 Tax=Mesomycoplasma neurolyticum TaxID=2120 RepID=A0A449A4Y5_9BACT|nr:hypothetical protein [Mesomycoplasma neurolyticum]VEU59297.1 Uncharacterised protein [Mesomycoplasma neurolyticum]
MLKIKKNIKIFFLLSFLFMPFLFTSCIVVTKIKENDKKEPNDSYYWLPEYKEGSEEKGKIWSWVNKTYKKNNVEKFYYRSLIKRIPDKAPSEEEVYEKIFGQPKLELDVFNYKELKNVDDFEKVFGQNGEILFDLFFRLYKQGKNINNHEETIFGTWKINDILINKKIPKKELEHFFENNNIFLYVTKGPSEYDMFIKNDENNKKIIVQPFVIWPRSHIKYNEYITLNIKPDAYYFLPYSKKYELDFKKPIPPYTPSHDDIVNEILELTAKNDAKNKKI